MLKVIRWLLSVLLWVTGIVGVPEGLRSIFAVLNLLDGSDLLRVGLVLAGLLFVFPEIKARYVALRRDWSDRVSLGLDGIIQSEQVERSEQEREAGRSPQVLLPSTREASGVLTALCPRETW